MASKPRRAAHSVIVVLLLLAFAFPLSTLAPSVKASVLYDSGNPTPAEQLVLEYINRARSNPFAEGQRLGIDIHEGLSDPTLVSPRPPLAMNKILLGIAEAHTMDMYLHNYFSHNDLNGTTPYDRMVRAGYNYLIGGENMAGGTDQSAAQLEDLMMMDPGTVGRGHRINLLNVNPYPCSDPPCAYSEVGIGYYQAIPNAEGLGSLITEDFGAASAGSFLVGVVYNDKNNNNFYDIGEGIAGVMIAPSTGGYYAVSSTSGGYVIPIGATGTMTVTASGPGFGPITRTVTLSGTSIKLDFTPTQTGNTTSTSTQTSNTTSIFSTSSTQTTSFATSPYITFTPASGPAGSNVVVTGSRFSGSDTSCSLSGSAVGASSCSISGGTLFASFQVANVVSGSYLVTAMGSPVSDAASAIFTIGAFSTQTTSSTGATTNTTRTSTHSTQSTNTTLSFTNSSTSLQQTSATTVISQTSTTNTQASTTALGPSDFSISASSSDISMAQASTGQLTLSVQSVGSFAQDVNFQTSGLPEGVGINFQPNPVSLTPGGIASSTGTVIVTRSVPTGIYPFMIIGTSGPITKQIQLNLHVSACLIATATFGSELAPEVQFLRDFRDYKILKTFAGTSFMIAFNAWYYSFSPSVAHYESINPALRAAIKFTIYPLIWVLRIGSIVFDLFPYNHEVAAIFSGITIGALLGIISLAGPMLIVRRRFSTRVRLATRTLEKTSFFVFLGSLLVVSISEILKIEMFMTTGASALILSTMILSAVLTTRRH